MNTSLLEVRNLQKIYYRATGDSLYALENINLSICPGEIYGLLGVNGAGKTTLSSILATIHPPTTGSIMWKDRSIYQNILSYRKAIGFCPQYQNLDTLLNVRDNLVFAGKYFLLSAHRIEKQVEQLLDTFHLTSVQENSIDTLSGGMKQRLLIARALVHQPEILILDEPTAGLDPDMRRLLWDLIKQLQQEGTTIIFTTHYLDEAEYLADRICILNKGHVQLIAQVHELRVEHNMARLEDIFFALSTKETV